MNKNKIILPAILLCSMFACVSSQKIKKEKKTQIDQPTMVKKLAICDFLTQIPDSLLVNYAKENIKEKWLNLAESKTLLSGEQEEVDRDPDKIRLVFHEPQNNQLMVDYGNDEESVNYELQFWEGENDRHFLGITRSFIDHCCSYSNFYFYEIDGAQLVDVTKEKVPAIYFADFVQEDFIPENENHDKLNFSKEISTEGYYPTIEIELEFDGIGFTFSEADYDIIIEHLITDKLYLVWEGNGFKKTSKIKSDNVKKER